MSFIYRIARYLISSAIALSVSGIVTIALPNVAAADGAVVSPPNYYVQETAQKAVVFYEEATSTETLVVGIDYQGTAQDFGWLIPTPSQPTVERGSQNLFANVEAITDPYSNSYKSSEESALVGTTESATPSTVTVVSEQQVAYYDVTVLTATNTEDLVNWFTTNGYKYPEAYSYILEDYITNGWYFTAMRINPTLVNTSGVTTNVLTGQAVPVQLTFTAENAVYPLRISSIIEDVVYTTTSEEVPPAQPKAPSSPTPHSVPTSNTYIEPYNYTYQNVELYVIADHKVTSNNSALTLGYGNWVSKAEIASWAVDTNGNPWIEPRNDVYYLTKLSGYLYDYQMTDDVFFTEATNNDVYTQDDIYAWEDSDYVEFGAIVLLVSMLVFAGMLISPFGIVHIIAAIVRGKAKSRGWKIAAHIVQWANIAMVKLFTAAVAIITWDDLLGDLPNLFNDYLHTEDAGGVVGLAVGVCMFIVTLVFATLLQSIIMLVRRRRRAKAAALVTVSPKVAAKRPKRRTTKRKK